MKARAAFPHAKAPGPKAEGAPHTGKGKGAWVVLCLVALHSLAGLQWLLLNGWPL